MGAEMISGPDLGGGYLHQLTIERGDASARFTHHIQDGGMDAGGPAPGEPVPFGFVPSGGMCTFGGRHCWHRDFELAESGTGRVRAAYNRWRLVAAVLLEQQYRGGPTPIASALSELLDRIGPALKEAGIPWHVGGSAGLWLRGLAVAPMDLDLGTTLEGAGRMADLLEPFLIEPFARTRWAGGGARWAARAFLGTIREGMRVEWSVPATADPPRGSEREWAFGAGGRAADEVEWNGGRVPVSPPEYALLRWAARGRWERVESVLSAAPSGVFSRLRLDRLLSDHTLDGRSEARLLKALDD